MSPPPSHHTEKHIKFGNDDKLAFNPTSGDIVSDQMARIEAALVDMEALKVSFNAEKEASAATVQKLTSENTELKQQLAALKTDLDAVKAELKANNTALSGQVGGLKTRVDELEAAAATAAATAVGGASMADLADLKSNITKRADSHAAELTTIQSGIAALNTTTLELADAVHPNMSWCPGGAKHVNAEVRWKGSIDGTGEDAVISEGVYCISDDVDFGSAVFFIKTGTTVQIFGRPIEGGGPMIAMRFGGVDVAKDAVLKMSHLSLQRLNRPGTNQLCRKDAAFIGAIKRGEVSGLSFSSTAERDECLKGYQNSCCSRNIDAYETWMGAGNEYAGVQGIIRVWGSLFLQDGEVAHTVANAYSYGEHGELTIFAAYSGSISLTRLEIFDNVMGKLIYALTDSGRPVSSEITMSECTVIGAGLRGQPQFDGGSYNLGIIYAQGKSSSGKGSTITIKGTHFRDIYTSDYNRVVASRDATVSIQSTTYENCILSGHTGSPPSHIALVGC